MTLTNFRALVDYTDKICAIRRITMGKWAEVHCSCANRHPLEGSSLSDQPHRKKRRLTKKERDEAQTWENNRKDMFECGHRDGATVQLWPGDIITVGYLIGAIFGNQSTFTLFPRVGDWRSYDDELLLLQPDEATVWLNEIETMLMALQGVAHLPGSEVARLVEGFFQFELASLFDLKQRVEDISREMPFARTAFVKEGVLQEKPPDMKSTTRKIEAALLDAARLCRASKATGNPIRLLW